MKYYHMIIQRRGDFGGDSRREYISTTQGAAPVGWVCVGVCGFHEKPRAVQFPCRNCVYFNECGDNMRTAQCNGRKTRRESKQEARTQ